jgi:ABC-type nitrate/sulfonate/bicarbonate transport system permease component
LKRTGRPPHARGPADPDHDPDVHRVDKTKISMNSFWTPYLSLSTRARYGLAATSILTVLLVWSALSGLNIVSAVKLPSPWAVAKALAYLSYHDGNSLLAEATLASISRVVMASVLVVVIGVPVGVLMGGSPKINALLSPLVDPFRSAPVVAVLPILVMWLGIGELMKVTFLFLGAVVYLVPMVRDAILAVPERYWTSARDLGATPWECVFRALFPMALPRIADAVIVAVSVSWTYITVAEYVNAQQGLGQLIQNARRFSANDQVFAGIFVIIVLALVTYQGMLKVKKAYFGWEVK